MLMKVKPPFELYWLMTILGTSCFPCILYRMYWFFPPCFSFKGVFLGLLFALHLVVLVDFYGPVSCSWLKKGKNSPLYYKTLYPLWWWPTLLFCWLNSTSFPSPFLSASLKLWLPFRKKRKKSSLWLLCFYFSKWIFKNYFVYLVWKFIM